MQYVRHFVPLSATSNGDCVSSTSTISRKPLHLTSASRHILDYPCLASNAHI